MTTDRSVTLGTADDVLATEASRLRRDLDDLRSTVLARIGELVVGGVDAIPIPAGAFAALQGSPFLVDIDSSGWAAGWNLPDGSTSVVEARVEIPSGWTAVTIDVWWTLGITSGNVRWSVAGLSRAAGDGIKTANTTDLQTLGAPAVAFDLKRTTFHTGGLAVAGGELLNVDVGRIGGDGADTSNGAASVLSVTVRRHP